MKIIAFTAHPDDEISCAGLLHKNFLEGGENLVVCFTGAGTSREDELKKSCDIIGTKYKILEFDDLSIKVTKSLKIELKDLISKFQPEIAILQSNDYHLDHQDVNRLGYFALEMAAHGETFESWFTPVILELECSSLIPYPDLIVNVDEEQKIKVKAFEAHISQMEKKHIKKYYFDVMEKKARLRGVQIGSTYGEAYSLKNLKIVGNFYPRSRGCKSIKDIIKTGQNSSLSYEGK